MKEISQVRDIESLNIYQELKELGWPHEQIMSSISAAGRDNARTPMQWDDTENAGFTTGTPWIEVNPNYKEINAKAALADQDSIFYYYKALIALRKGKEWGELHRDGTYHPFLEEDRDIFAYERRLNGKRLLVLGNFHDVERTVALPGTIASILLSNYQAPQINGVQAALRPYEAFIAELDA